MEKQRFIFDLDGTLLLPDYSYEKDYFKSVLSRDDAEFFIPMIPELLEDYENSYRRYDTKKLSRYLTAHSGILITDKIIRGWKEAFGETESKMVDGVVETLEELSRRDKDMAILTNWFLSPQLKRLEKAGIKDYFTDFYGGEYAIKPHAESYRMSCGRYSMEDCVMIGDSLNRDVLPAMAVGLDAIYFNPNNNENFDKEKVKSIGRMQDLGRYY